MHDMQPILPHRLDLQTPRLTLVPFTHELITAAINDRALFAQRLGAHVPDDWPGPDFADLLPMLAQQLAQAPADAPWTRLVIYTADRALIGDVGCHGPPDENGVVEIGYSIVPACRSHGYATEAAQGLIDWLWTQHVARITAGCDVDNVGSIRVLEKLGMRRIGQEGNELRWELVEHDQLRNRIQRTAYC